MSRERKGNNKHKKNVLHVTLSTEGYKKGGEAVEKMTTYREAKEREREKSERVWRELVRGGETLY